MKKLRLIISYINYFFKAKTRYTIHSPFVYELVTKVLRDNTHYDDFVELEETTKRQSKRKDLIETVDFGANSGGYSYTTSMVEKGKIVKQRTSGIKQLKLLYKLSKFLKPDVILEFGTAAGISAAYMSKGYPAVKLTTLEGCASMADFAESTFQKLHIQHIEVISGNFDITINDTLNRIGKIDLVFFDGNHRKEPTLRYFDACLKNSDENSVFVFDDIHWSSEMEVAWEAIKAHPDVSITIDLFWLGLVFFKKGVAKQDFIIRY
jgi:predicted O-methyltransferase YrrM